jgi:DNA-binding transcriptional LysR family regulator
MHEFLSRKPFDLYSLHLFQLVVKHQSFTRAAREAGLSQSALTRQMQALEERIGVDLINRTTRSVEVTEAGQYLAVEASRLIGGVSSMLEGLLAEFTTLRPLVRVGVSRSMSMAHMPGLFHANRQRHPNVACQVSYRDSAALLTALDANELDVGVLCPPSPLPGTVDVTHRFKDAFVLIASDHLSGVATAGKRSDRLRAWLTNQAWLMISESTNTGKAMRRWLKRQGLVVSPSMELDSFDLIINLVASGLGVALVPQRALALYRRKQSIIRLKLPDRFVREVVVVTRKHRRVPPHVTEFVSSILF